VVVVDSFSADATTELARSAGARVLQHAFTGFGDQRNWSLDNAALKHPWALILDADERVPPELVAEMAERLPAADAAVAAFRVRRRFHLWGKWLRFSSLYPTWVVRLLRVGRIRYVNRGHAETQVVDGRIEALRQDLLDENHKPMSDWWERQDRYATREAEYELAQPPASWRGLWGRDPLLRRAALKGLVRDVPGRPLWYFLYVCGLRLGFLDGVDGLRFCLMKAQYQAMIVRKKRALEKQRSASETRPLGSG
jgi:glycosyltransferase involved in cell wall biosynthesis